METVEKLLVRKKCDRNCVKDSHKYKSLNKQFSLSRGNRGKIQLATSRFNYPKSGNGNPNC